MVPGTNLVLQTTRASIVVQFITGLLGIYGLTIPIPDEASILKGILTLEMIVQAVEFIFYIVLVYIAHIPSMTLFRYGDWFLSTPTMLFTMAAYFKYTSETPPNSLEGFWADNQNSLTTIFLANFGMLAFGFAGEMGVIPMSIGFWLGTACFAISFYTLYTNFAKDSRTKPLYFFMTGVWSLYGVAFLQSASVKNIAYNGLDILAKNFFGLYLSYIIWTKYSKTAVV